jgi:hypothetical protein
MLEIWDWETWLVDAGGDDEEEMGMRKVDRERLGEGREVPSEKWEERGAHAKTRRFKGIWGNVGRGGKWRVWSARECVRLGDEDDHCDGCEDGFVSVY